MDVLKAQAIIDEYMTQKGLNPPPPMRKIDFDADMFDRQVAFVNDPAKRKAALCSRRAGKSRMASYYLIKTAYERPNSICVFIAITRQSAKDIIWDYLKDIDHRYKLQCDIKESVLSIILPNGSKIHLTGADNDKEMRKLLGKYFDLCIIDEAEALGNNLERLIKEVLAPTTIDYDGTICAISTPGIVCHGIFYDITTGKTPGWSVHKWTMMDNPKLPRKGWIDNREAILNQILTEENIDKNSSLYKRQYLGQWVEGTEALVYDFSYNRNIYDLLPADTHWNYLISIDYGITDSSAILIGAYSFEHDTLHIVRDIKAAGINPAKMANKVKALWDEYQPIALVVDGNGIGAAFTSQMASMYDMPFELAEKTNKVAFVELLNDDFKSGKIKISSYCEKTIKELTSYMWADPKLKELPKIAEDHLCDSLLYMWRKSLHFKGQIPEPIPKVTDESYSDYLRQQELDRVHREANTNWWE